MFIDAIGLGADVLIRGEWRLQGVRARAGRVTALVGSDHNAAVFVVFAFGFFVIDLNRSLKLNSGVISQAKVL